MATTPTSNLEQFKVQLSCPNQNFPFESETNNLVKVEKNIVLGYIADTTGCGKIRGYDPLMYLNSAFAKSGKLVTMLSPTIILQDNILLKCRSVYFQRAMSESNYQIVKLYKENQKKFGYKMVWDLDDFIWTGPNEGECIPEYNFCSETFDKNAERFVPEIMKLMDVNTVSTEFLKNYIEKRFNIKGIKVIPNTVPFYSYGPDKRSAITSRIEKPRVLYAGSPTHYHNGKKLKGDWDNAWSDWVLNAVKEDKIILRVMGGLPFFLEEVRDKIQVIEWVNTLQYHLPIKEFKPDFYIAPLVPNYFNFSKSDLKRVEASATGCVFIGTTNFKNGMPSPYDNGFMNAPEDITVEGIQNIIDTHCETELFNSVIQKQYQWMDDEGRWLESKTNVDRLLTIF